MSATRAPFAQSTSDKACTRTIVADRHWTSPNALAAAATRRAVRARHIAPSVVPSGAGCAKNDCMALTFRVHRATPQDVDVLRGFCADATGNRATLAGARRDRLEPGEWVAARAPVVVVSEGTAPIGFAGAVAQSVPVGAPRCAEVIVYVAPSHRRRGASRAAMAELVSAARTMGLWKVLAHALPTDAAMRGLLTRFDFREVGVLVKHVQVEGAWNDVVVYERLVMAARKSAPSLPDI
jgi:L-amino acid N-acyltransferase YncA